MITLHWGWFLLFIVITGLLSLFILIFNVELAKNGLKELYIRSISENYINFEVKVIKNILTTADVEWETMNVSYEVSSLLFENHIFQQKLTEVTSECGFELSFKTNPESLSVELLFEKL